MQCTKCPGFISKSGGLSFSQTDQWPMAPKTGYPTARKPEPTKLWHFTAATRKRSPTRRIAAVMVVSNGTEKPECDVQSDGDKCTVRLNANDAKTTVKIDLSSVGAKVSPLLQVRCQPATGEIETLSVQ